MPRLNKTLEELIFHKSSQQADSILDFIMPTLNELITIYLLQG
jgi:hypothetical protein